MNKDVLEQFGLDIQQTRLLFSMQRHIVEQDIGIEKNEKYKEKKVQWLHIWEKGILQVLNNTDNKTNLDFIKGEEELRKTSNHIINMNENFNISQYLILLELSLFVPYFPIGEFQIKFYERVNLDTKYADFLLEKFADMLEVDKEFIERYRKTFKNSIRSISGFYTRMLIGAGVGAVLLAITAGFAAPFIGGLAAPLGLYGAAAINAGLAALGGGAVAAGGFGIAGGLCVIVGGGTIFGVLSGGVMGAALSSSSEFALREGAKLEVVMKEIILLAQKDVRLAQEMIKSQQDVIRELEKQLCDLRFNEKENKEKIKTLAKSIDYLRTSLNSSYKVLNDIETTV